MWIPLTRGVHGYKGIHVGFRQINYTKTMARTLREFNYLKVSIDYDDDSKMVRFIRAANGYKLGAKAITAKVASLIPSGRYLCTKEEKNEILFTYCK
jgi:hypothetical protein